MLALLPFVAKSEAKIYQNSFEMKDDCFADREIGGDTQVLSEK